VKLHVFIISAVDEGEWLASCSGLITPRKMVPALRWIGVVEREGSRPIVSHFKDSAIPADLKTKCSGIY
jgi:hypothetical protein